MSKLTYYGPVKASCKREDDPGKFNFIPVGRAFKDEEGRLVIKLESLPLPHEDWNGFLNIYEGEKK